VPVNFSLCLCPPYHIFYIRYDASPKTDTPYDTIFVFVFHSRRRRWRREAVEEEKAAVDKAEEEEEVDTRAKRN